MYLLHVLLFILPCRGDGCGLGVPGSVVLLLLSESAADDSRENQSGHHMVECMMVINFRVMNAQAGVLASFKGNLAIWQVLAGEGLAGPLWV